MSIHVHKTGLNKTLGQQSDAIVSTDLIGNFIPSASVFSTYWQNQVTSPSTSALRRYNGITHNSSSPANFQFDGTNDFLGEASSSYGGNPFNVAFQNAYTISQWVYLPNTWTTGNKHVMFMLYNTDSNLVYAYIDGQSMKMESKTSSGNLGPFLIGSAVNLINNRNKWLYHTISHDGSGRYKYYINGAFIDSTNAFYAPSTTAKPLVVGFKNAGSGTAFYTSANVKVGHIHVHSSELKNSQIRQNYLAIASPVNTRLYGETALA